MASKVTTAPTSKIANLNTAIVKKTAAIIIGVTIIAEIAFAAFAVIKVGYAIVMVVATIIVEPKKLESREIIKFADHQR